MSIDFGPHGKLEYNDNSTINVKTIAQTAANLSEGKSQSYALTTAYSDGNLRIVHGVVGSDVVKALDVVTFVPQDPSISSGRVNTIFSGNVEINQNSGGTFVGNLTGTAKYAIHDANGLSISESYTNCDNLYEIFNNLYEKFRPKSS